MTTAQETPCALGVTDRTLSDFRSQGLDAREMERLRAHVEECPACQQRLAEYEALAQALRGQREPENHALLWRDVQASIAAAPSRSRRMGSLLTRRHAAQVWMALGSVAAVVALSVGFVAVFASHRGPAATSTATHIATGTATNTPKVIEDDGLTWKVLTVPKGFPDGLQGGTFAAVGPNFTTANGRVAYACQMDTKYVSAPTVWATTDTGANWSVITPPNLPANLHQCGYLVDMNNAQTLIVWFSQVDAKRLAPSNQRLVYTSFDGGSTWSQPAGLQGGFSITTLASGHGNYYANHDMKAANGYTDVGLYVSHDHMQTWTHIDGAVHDDRINPPADQKFSGLVLSWVNPVTGGVLGVSTADNAWYTTDDGAHWQKMQFPSGVFIDPDHSPVWLYGNHPTTDKDAVICGNFGSEHATQGIDRWIACTTNFGASWYKLPELPQETSKSSLPQSNAYYGIFGNSFLAMTASMTVPTPATSEPTASGTGVLHSTNIYPGVFHGTLYALSLSGGPNAQWKRIGGVPSLDHSLVASMAPVGNGFVFWISASVSYSQGQNTPTPVATIQPYYYVATYP